MECKQVREHFPAFDEEKFSPPVLEHLGSCERCRAELAEYRALEANLGSLASVEISPPPWLLGAISERVGHSLRRRAAIANARRQIGTVTTRQLGEHRVAAGSALGLAVVAGAVLFGRLRRTTRVPGVKVA
jgi:anti-sigma factor RsiW